MTYAQTPAPERGSPSQQPRATNSDFDAQVRASLRAMGVPVAPDAPKSAPAGEQSAQEVNRAREHAVVHGLIERAAANRGFAATLRMGMQSLREYPVWGIVAQYGINVELDHVRKPYVFVATLIGKNRPASNGSVPLGKAIAMAYEGRSTEGQARTRLHQLCAARTLDQVIGVISQLDALIESRTPGAVDYVRLVRQLRQYPYQPESIRAQWAQEFYGLSRACAKELV